MASMSSSISEALSEIGDTIEQDITSLLSDGGDAVAEIGSDFAAETGDSLDVGLSGINLSDGLLSAGREVSSSATDLLRFTSEGEDEEQASGGFERGSLFADDDADEARSFFEGRPSLLVDSLLPVPDYRSSVLAGQPGAWDSFHRAVQDLDGGSDAERFAYPAIFAAEGGARRDPTSSAASGILQATLDRARERGVAALADLKDGAEPRDLTLRQRAAVYRDYFDDALAPVGGRAALDALGNRHAAAALADTLFRHGPGRGTELIQKTNNHLFRQYGMPEIREDRIMGYGTFEPIRYFAADEKLRDRWLDILGETRLRHLDGREVDRINWFQFRPRW